MDIKAFLLTAILTALVSACSSFSHTNRERPDPVPKQTRATFDIKANRGEHPETLMIMSLSGGGSRAAYLSASVMLRLEEVFKQEEINLLHEVDAISSVSGGSLPAAYYVISTDSQDLPVTHGRVWDEETVRKLMKKDYIRSWFGNWFWPTNIGKFWFTAYDRSDIMAQTFADNMYDAKPWGRDLTMGDMLETRPYLVLNSTSGTAMPDPSAEGDSDQTDSARKFGDPFTFTRRDFDSINSDINDYSLARAVMATATFPAVFNYMTLQDYKLSADPACDKDCDRFVHVFDGGNADNLGLKSVSDMLDKLPCQDGNYDRLVVILVDAFTGNSGISNEKADPRKGFDFFVDTNFLDATDSLLSANRKEKIEHFEESFKNRCSDPSKAIFYHIQFDDVKDDALRRELNRIKTDFRISDKDASCIDTAVEQLLTPQNTCLTGIRDLLVSGHHQTDQICTY